MARAYLRQVLAQRRRLAVQRHRRIVLHDHVVEHPCDQPGMRVVYLAAPAAGVLNADIVLTSGHGPEAFGHVVLTLVTRTGTVTFSGGTGKFAKFRANVAVTLGADGLWHWEGSYSFASSDDD